MNEALSSILCGEERWYFDLEQTYIMFHKDSTGVLCAGSGFSWWILSEFEWKCTAIEPLDHVETPVGHIVNLVTLKKSPHLLGQVILEMTLTKRLPSFARNTDMEKSTIVNEGSLKDGAFRPKSFTVRVEQGNFKLPSIIGNEFPSYDSRWARRLVFDISPYPPASEWKDTYGNLFWDCKQFVGRSFIELEKQGRAMNDSSTMSNTCIAS